MEKSSGKDLSGDPPVPRAFSKKIPAMGLFPVPQSKTSKNTKQIKKPIHQDIGGVNQGKPLWSCVEDLSQDGPDAGADNVVRVKRLPSSGLAFLLPAHKRRVQSAEIWYAAFNKMGDGFL